MLDLAAPSLDDWLRNQFFDEHCKLFQHRPFIWHIWDGRKRDGFHALVNYHKLAEGDGKGRRLLESLTYSYLGDWIARQQDGVKRGEGGAEDRLAAALELQKRLVAILEGEPPFDLFVRWKPIEEQPIGWEPDINDGVRLNIRPFMAQDIPGGKKGAGILRAKPNIHWKKDRGKGTDSLPGAVPLVLEERQVHRRTSQRRASHKCREARRSGRDRHCRNEEIATVDRTGNTVIEALVRSLEAAAKFNPNDVVHPYAVLWTDHDAQWQPLIPQLRRLLPQLLTFGDYEPAHRIGPAIWLRSVVDRALPEIEIPEGATPIVYLPGVSRQELRAVQECPDSLKPLVELQYRGVCWTQKNGKDWTVEAFLVSEEGGLGLDVARDATTRRAMLGALAELATTSVDRLKGKHLEAEDFDKLFSDDPAKDLLLWLSDPEAVKSGWNGGRWSCVQVALQGRFQVRSGQRR